MLSRVFEESSKHQGSPIKKTALVSYILAVLPHVFTQQVPSCHVQAAPSVQLAGVGRQSGLHFATTQLSDQYGLWFF